MATSSMATPRRAFTTAGSAALASTAAATLGPGGCPYQPVTPRWLQEKSDKPKYPESHPTVIFVIGGPGAEKTAHCEHIAKEFRYVHMSIPDLLREEKARPDSDVAAVIEEHMSQGALVPTKIVCDVLMKAIERVPNWKRSRFLIDGYPKSLEQFEGFQAIVGSKVIIKSCIYLDCREATAEQRLLEQALSENASEDDARESIQKRLAKFREAVFDVQRRFQYEGLLERIDASREMEKVWCDILQYFVVEGYNDTQVIDGHQGSPAKAAWKLRDKQGEEIFPKGNAHTSTSYVKGPQSRGFNSYAILAKHRDKHTRNMRSPVDNFSEPMTMAQEIGWNQLDDGNHIGAKGTPRGTTTPRSFYPRNTCAMTRHLENMYSTNAQHIIRRW